MTRHNNTSVIEEVFNAVTHGIGVLLSVIGLIILLSMPGQDNSELRIVGFSVFGIAMILSYLASTFYHSLSFTKAGKIFKILDHSSIFILIAGTYTPFLLIALKGQLGFNLFFSIWILTISGIILKAFYIHRFMKLSVALYLFMGWLILFGIKPLMAALSVEEVFLLALGGLFYTFGVIFYLLKKLPFHHAIWHVFVLCGSTSHFLALLWYNNSL